MLLCVFVMHAWVTLFLRKLTACITEQSPRLHESTWQERGGARTSAGGSGCSAGGPGILVLTCIREERKGYTLLRNDPTLEMTLPPNPTNT